MSEAKYTAGPWRAVLRVNPVWMAETARQAIGCIEIGSSADSFWIAQVQATVPEQGKANAHLIEAAPELLAACKFVEEHIGDPERTPRDLYPAFGLDARTALEMLRAAIAKAEGRA